MKKFYILALVAAMFAACATDTTEDVAIGVPETLRVSFEESDSRIQLANGKTVWTKGDQVSVFYRSNANQKWQYKGETGERVGELQQVDAGSATREMDCVVVVYPYNESYYINPSTCNVQASLPAVQTYLADSYGLNGNIMISHGEYNNISLKSVCGWLKLQLTGNGEKVQTITLKGNNGEQVAGEIYINSADATAILSSDAGDADDSEIGGAGGNLLFENTILNEVTLNCGEGVTLGAEPTAFYIALPPQEFSKGLTVEVACSDGSTMTKSTEKEVVIARNTIQPMAVFGYIETPPNNEIWYTSSGGNVVTPYASDVFGANIISNTYENGKGVIKFDGNITSIGEDAFYKCISLTSVTIPDSITEFGDWAFYECTSLTSVNIPDSVTKIWEAAFYYCTSLTSVNIPDSVTWIGNGAFISCTSLTSITIPDSVTSIGNQAFDGCTSLTSITIGDSVTEIGDNAFYGCTSLTSVTIPDSVTKIGDWAFDGCTSLTSITIGDSVTEIGDNAFYGCTSLTSVTIPDSVTKIGDWAFDGCKSLKEVYYKGDLSAWCKIDFSTLNSNPMYYGAKLYLNGVELTGDITIPSDVTKIKNYTFYNCTSLTSATIPDSVTSIGIRAFNYCTSLTSVTIGNSVTSIGYDAFSYCRSLTSVTIGNSVTSIGEDAFYDCTSLKEVYCKPITPPSGDYSMFYHNASGRKIYVPRASVDAYKAASGWSNYKSYIEPYDFE